MQLRIKSCLCPLWVILLQFDTTREEIEEEEEEEEKEEEVEEDEEEVKEQREKVGEEEEELQLGPIHIAHFSNPLFVAFDKISVIFIEVRA